MRRLRAAVTALSVLCAAGTLLALLALVAWPERHLSAFTAVHSGYFLEQFLGRRPYEELQREDYANALVGAKREGWFPPSRIYCLEEWFGPESEAGQGEEQEEGERSHECRLCRWPAESAGVRAHCTGVRG